MTDSECLMMITFITVTIVICITVIIYKIIDKK